jgi:hypothetical protein
MKFSALREESVIQFVNLYALDYEVGGVGSGIYLSYPDHFYKLLLDRNVDFKDENQTQFSLASFLMFKVLIKTDDIFDEGVLITSDLLASPISHYNLSIRLLSDLFNLKSEFWNCFNARQKDFIECVSYEKNIINSAYKRQIYFTPIDFAYYKKYYLQKCSFSSLAIDGVYILNNKSCGIERYNLALSVNDLFNIAFCILDDVEDFRKDIDKNQINFAHHYLMNKFSPETENIENYLQDSVELFYTEGIALEVVNIAKDKLNCALDELDKFPNSEDLKLLIEIKLTDLNNKMQVIREYSK